MRAETGKPVQPYRPTPGPVIVPWSRSSGFSSSNVTARIPLQSEKRSFGDRFSDSFSPGEAFSRDPLGRGNDVVNLAGPPDFGGCSLRMTCGSMPRPYGMLEGRSRPFQLIKIFIIHNRENFWHFRRNSLILFQWYCIIGVISERAGTCPFGGLLRVSEEGKGGRFSLYPFAGPIPFYSRGETTWENSLKP